MNFNIYSIKINLVKFHFPVNKKIDIWLSAYGVFLE